MTVHYLPINKIIIDDVSLEFGESRSSVRQKLKYDHTEQNQVFNFDSSRETIYQRRDIYDIFDGSENFFFMGYDKNDFLCDIEVHRCDKIKVLSSVFDFNTELDNIASQLERYSPSIKQDKGEYFFKELKLVIVDKMEMGDEGTTLGYFYCASDISHLE